MTIGYTEPINSAVITCKGIRHELTQDEINGLGAKYVPLGVLDSVNLPKNSTFSIAFNDKRYDKITVRKLTMVESI